MKIKLLFLTIFLTAILLDASAREDKINVIPEPVAVKTTDGEFILDKNVRLIINSGSADVSNLIQNFKKKIEVPTGINLPIASNSNGKNISLEINESRDEALGNEGYRLNVSESSVSLRANTSKGLFYGIQTILQLLPVEIESSHKTDKVSWKIPCVEILDYPRFDWRGLMLDVSRHFFTKGEVLRYLDEMARYKYNRLHLHLADDQGWRIEIKALPNLTKIGAWRVERTGLYGDLLPAFEHEPATDGGFYTQEDMKEIIAYAAKLHIVILPEIDVPAHSLALIASYPELSCTQKQYSVVAGRRGPYVDNVLCVGNETVFEKLDTIFTEIANLFPCKYIHIGGDEADKSFWENCPKCQKRMCEEHLDNSKELQSYFVKRMEKMLKAKGKKLIGWDEILEGGLAPEATVMSWRGMQGGIEAAKQKHHVIMTPQRFCYLDLYQSDRSAEPPTYGMCLLSKSYSLEPVPEGVDDGLILGGQGNLWTESVPNYRQVQYMTWPRALALAEVFWSPKQNKNWEHFVSKVENQFQRFDLLNIKYARSFYNPIISVNSSGYRDVSVSLSTEIEGLVIYYSFDNINPDEFYPKYEGEPLTFPQGASMLKAVTYRGGKQVGSIVSITKEGAKQRLKEASSMW